MEKSKNKNALLLTSIYQNTQTALQSFDNILPSIKSKELVKEAGRQSDEYKDIAKECKNYAKQEEFELPDNNIFEKIRLWSSVKMGTLADKSITHITEMLMIGTLMGIIQCLKDFSDYKNCDKEFVNLLKKLLELQEKNLEILKSFI